MVKIKLLGFFFVLLFLISGVFAVVNINVPSSASVNADFAVVAECADTLFDKCRVEWSDTAGNSGFYDINSSAISGIDTHNFFAKHSRAGIYTYSIFRCNSDCSTKIFAASDVIAIGAASANSYSVATSFNYYNNSLRITGRGNLNGTSKYVTLSFSDSPIDDINVNINSNHRFNSGWIDTTSWPKQIYTVTARFFDEDDNQIAVRSRKFNFLLYVQALGAFDELNPRVIELEDNVIVLSNDINDLSSDINDLSSEVNYLFDLVNDIDNNLVLVRNDLNSLKSDLNDQLEDIWDEIDDIIDHLVDLDNNYNQLNDRLTSLEGVVSYLMVQINSMNHGTINYTFNKSLPYGLAVKGKMPYGATSAQVSVINPVGNVVLFEDTANLNFADNTYSKNIQWGVLPKEILRLRTRFFGFGSDNSKYTVETSFVDILVIDINDRTIYLEEQLPLIDANIAQLHEQDANFSQQLLDVYAHLAIHDQNIINLAQNIQDVSNVLNQKIDDVNDLLITEVARLDTLIIDLQNQLNDLRDVVDRMNLGTVWLMYDREANFLRVKGEAPEGATGVTIRVRNLDRDELYTYTASVNATDNSYIKDIPDVNTWNPEIYDIAVQFHNYTGQWVNAQFYALAVLAEFQGFGFVEDKTFEYFLVLPNTRPINFNFGAITDGQYDFNLVLTDGNNSYNNFLLTSNIGKYTGKNFNTEFNVPEKGNYLANLIATNTNTNEVVVSNDFNILVIDLYDSLGANIVVSDPIYNDNNFSLQANTFYTNKDFNLTSVVSGVYINRILSYFLTNPLTFDTKLGEKLISSGENTVTAFKNGILDLNNEGLHTITIVMDSEYVDSIDFNLGIDTTKPQFPDLNTEAIIPSAGYYSEILHVDVNTWDELSGVKTVEIELIDKNTNLVTTSAFANYDYNTGFWFHDFNTVAIPVPDGYYDIRAIVTDVAGNVDDRLVDPGVDNTPPVINSVVLSQNPMLRNTVISIDANVTDNFSGVKSVNAIITDGNTSEILLLTKTSGTALNGIWSADFNLTTDWNIGLYKVIIDANDYAFPENQATTIEKDVNVISNYYFNIDTSASTTTGSILSFDGNFRNDLNSVPTIDGNLIILTSSVVSDLNVEFDANGLYTITTNALPAGTHIIDLNYNISDYNYTEQIIITVATPEAPVTTGGGGGAGGIPLTQEQEEVDDEETTETVPETEEEVEDVQTDTQVDELEVFETIDEEEIDIGPTGLFGLGGVVESTVAPLLLILIIGGIIFFSWKKFK